MYLFLVTEVPASLNKIRCILLGRRGLNPMTQIHHMSCRSSLSHNFLSTVFDRCEVTKQNTRVQISLDSSSSLETGRRTACGDTFTSLGHVDSPIEGDYVGTRGGHSFDECSRVFDVDDCWH